MADTEYTNKEIFVYNIQDYAFLKQGSHIKLINILFKCKLSMVIQNMIVLYLDLFYAYKCDAWPWAFNLR